MGQGGGLMHPGASDDTQAHTVRPHVPALSAPVDLAQVRRRIRIVPSARTSLPQMTAVTVSWLSNSSAAAACPPSKENSEREMRHLRPACLARPTKAAALRSEGT